MENENSRLEIMIDIETLGLKPGSVVASIGVIAFDAEGNHADRLYVKLDLDDQIKQGMTVDGSTIKWWLGQSDAARKSTFTDDSTAVVSPITALNMLTSFVTDIRPEAIFAKGPQFDIVNIEWLYEAYGLKAPWSYRAIRDLRTLINEVGGGTFIAEGMVVSEGEPEIVQHNALDDAAYQIRELIVTRTLLGAF